MKKTRHTPNQIITKLRKLMDPFIRSDDGFLYMQVASSVSDMIENGTLRPGDQVPSVRQFCETQGVSKTTVLHAYRILEDRGLIEAHPQSGFYVGSIDAAPSRDSSAPERPQSGQSVEMGERVHQLFARLSDPDVIPLGAALPDAELFPTERLASHLARVAHDSSSRTNAGSPHGHESLRLAFAQRSLLSGCAFDASDLVVTNGCTEAISLSLQAVTEPGDTVAIQSPTYFGFLLLLEKLGLRVLELPTSPHTGVALNDLERVLLQEDVSALLLTPTFCNPTGSLLPEDDKQRLCDLLEIHDLPLIEDDIYGDLYFGRSRPKPVKAFDTDGRVLYCSSVTKTMTPEYRIGFVQGGQYKRDVEVLKTTHSPFTAVPMQRAVAAFLDQGGYEKHLRDVRDQYRHTLRRMRQTAVEVFPRQTRVMHPDGGFLLWVELPDGFDAAVLARKALEQGISVAPGMLFSPSNAFDHGLRLNGGRLWSASIQSALETLGELAREMRDGLEHA